MDKHDCKNDGFGGEFDLSKKFPNEPNIGTTAITRKTADLRIKRNSVFKQVLQQWNQYVDKDGGFWTDVPIVHTDDDKDFVRP